MQNGEKTKSWKFKRRTRWEIINEGKNLKNEGKETKKWQWWWGI